MAKLYISEYADIAQTVRGGTSAAQEPEIASQVLDFSGGVQVSVAFNAATTIVYLHTDAICSVLFSADGTNATTSNRRMAADSDAWRGVPVGKSFKVSVIANS